MPQPDILYPNIASIIEEEQNISLLIYLPPSNFQESDVSFIFKTLPDNKARGNNLINSKILKLLPKKSILFLNYIINHY